MIPLLEITENELTEKVFESMHNDYSRSTTETPIWKVDLCVIRTCANITSPYPLSHNSRPKLWTKYVASFVWNPAIPCKQSGSAAKPMGSIKRLQKSRLKFLDEILCCSEEITKKNGCRLCYKEPDYLLHRNRWHGGCNSWVSETNRRPIHDGIHKVARNRMHLPE